MPDSTNTTADQQAAEAEVEEFRAELGPFVTAAETTRMPMIFTNAKEGEDPLIFANDAFLELTGYRRDDVLGESFKSLMKRGTGSDELKSIEAAFAATAESEPEICYKRKDGTMFWATVHISPVRDKNGEIVQHFVSLVDNTKNREEQARCKMLIDELNHRVKNTLSTVQSITRQALRTATDPATIGESIESRIFALSRSHDLLSHEGWQGAGLHDLIGAALEPFGVANGRTERFNIDGDNIRLLPKATLALGIAFHELATNAVKYGAFSNNAGTIGISWTIEPSPAGERLILHWREKDGPPVRPPSHKGFGSQVIERGLAHELGGSVKLEYPPEGVFCTVDIPAPKGLNE
ncbi:MAG: PAS domain-containing protein [Sphingomonas sp.]|uniref:HWE histidine kinase domain-containing protein n=1 Tax=Sphingomonas sp. TaxID=28214 RepID=UPI0017FA92C1|nr:HWE histidine kinase domain-containing protein [Sphingomonas sp.]MBA3666224.1 PAS domain-containing protein [Sphingomonas sp.]